MVFFEPVKLWPEAPFHTPILDRYKNREMLYDVLYCIAVGGLSTRADIARALQMDLSSIEAKTASLRKVARACKTLVNENLITQDLGKLWWITIYMLRLTPFGEEYWQNTYRLKKVNSDWDKLIKLHNGKRYMEHSAAVLLFVHHARLRGWNAEVMPEPEENMQPDVEIENDKDILYVEIERKASRAWEKKDRWKKQRLLQSTLTICMVSDVGAKNVAQRIDGAPEYECYKIASLQHLTTTAYQPNRERNMWLYQRGFEVFD